MFFLMSDWLRETVEPRLLPALDTDVARDIDIVSSFMGEAEGAQGGNGDDDGGTQPEP